MKSFPSTGVGWLFLLSAFLAAGCASPSRDGGGRQALEISRTLLNALARLGYLESGRKTNTFFIPAHSIGEANDTYVIYWQEKNVLFFYAAEPRLEVAEFPHLARGHEYEVKESTFVRLDDPGASTSTFLESYEWAFQCMIHATVNGRRFVLVHDPERTNLK